MLANQCLEHPSEPRGKPFSPDTLSRNAGTLAYQEDLVSETLRIRQLSIAAQAEQLFAGCSFILAYDTPSRVILFRQLDCGIGERTAALGFILLEIANVMQPGHELTLRVADMGSGNRLPGCVEFLREFRETRGDKHILRREMAIERHLVGARGLGDRVYADGMDAAPVK